MSTYRRPLLLSANIIPSLTVVIGERLENIVIPLLVSVWHTENYYETEDGLKELDRREKV